MIGINIRGIEGVQRALAKKSEALTKGVDAELTATTIRINAKQVRYTPVDTSRLGGGNTFDVSKPLDKSLRNKIEYAGYIEFGTGTFVFNNQPWIDAEIMALASTWKGKGIRRMNIQPRPFFFRAYFEERAKLIERIKKLIKE